MARLPSRAPGWRAGTCSPCTSPARTGSPAPTRPTSPRSGSWSSPSAGPHHQILGDDVSEALAGVRVGAETRFQRPAGLCRGRARCLTRNRLWGNTTSAAQEEESVANSRRSAQGDQGQRESGVGAARRGGRAGARRPRGAGGGGRRRAAPGSRTPSSPRPGPSSWPARTRCSPAPDLIVKVKEPIAAEYHRFREGQQLFTYLHLAADKPLTEFLMDNGSTPSPTRRCRPPTASCRCSPR